MIKTLTCTDEKDLDFLKLIIEREKKKDRFQNFINESKRFQIFLMKLNFLNDSF